MVKGVYADGEMSFIAYPDGKTTISAGNVAPGENDVIVGGQNANMKAGVAIAAIFPDASYTRIVIGPDYICFIDSDRFSQRLPKAAQIMFRAALDDSARRSIDEAVKEYAKFEDDSWDSEVAIEGTETLKASDYLSAMKSIRDSAYANITDRTLKTIVYGRICLYESFKAVMPPFCECLSPFELASKLLMLAQSKQSTNAFKS